MGESRPYRSMPLSNVNDSQDGRVDTQRKRVPRLNQTGKIAIDWTIPAINCTGFRTALP